MAFIVVTLAVLKEERSSSVRLRQLRNMDFMLVTCDVFRLLSPVMVVRFFMPSNQLHVVVGCMLLKELWNTTSRTFSQLLSLYHCGDVPPRLRL